MADKTIKITIEGTSKSAEKALGNVATEAKKTRKAIENLGKTGISKATSSITNAMNKVRTSFGSAKTSVDGFNKSLNAMTKVATVGAIGGLASAIVGVGLSAVKSAAQMRQYEIAFQTMLKSAKAGTVMLQELQKFAAATPFDVPGVVEAAQQLMAFGFEANEIIPTLTTLGDAAAGLGRGSEGVKTLGYALGQMKAAGTLKTQDMNQLTNAGINAWQMLADATGKSVAEIKEMTEKGMIDSVKAIKVLTDGMKDNFGGMMNGANKEVSGLVNSIEEGFGNASAVIGKFVTKTTNLQSILTKINDELGDTVDKLMKASNEGKSFSQALKDANLGVVATTFAGIASAVGVVFVGALAAAAGALVAFAGVSVSVVAAVAAIGSAIAGIVIYWDEVKATLGIVAGAITGIISGVGMAIVAMAEGAVGVIGDMFNSMLGYCPDWVNNTKRFFADLLEDIKTWSSIALSYVKKVFAVKNQSYLDVSDPRDTVMPGYEPKKKVAPTSVKKGTADITFNGATSTGNNDLARREAEANRLSEAIQKAVERNTDLQTSMQNLSNTINGSLLSGYEAFFNQLESKYARQQQQIEEMVKKQYEAYQEAVNYRVNAEKTGNQEVIKEAEALEQKRLALYQDAITKGRELTEANAEAEQKEKLSKDAEYRALKAELDYAQATMSLEQFRAFLQTEQMEKLQALEEEQTKKQEALESYKQGLIAVANIQKQFADSFSNGFANAFEGVITGTKSASAALADFAKSLLKNAAQIAAKWVGLFALYCLTGDPQLAARNASHTLFGMNFKDSKGNAIAFASGGYVRGAGTGKSDSINARLSNGEYVVNANAVRQFGINNLDAINSGKIYSSTVPAVNQASSSTMQNSSNVSLNVSAVDAESFSSFLERGGLDSIRQALFDNNRSFASEAGVW